MKIRLALGAIALAALAACGGGDPEGPAAPSTNETARVIAFGDSLTDSGTYTRAAQALLQGAGQPAGLPVGKFTNSPGPLWVESLATRLGTSIANERFEWGAASPASATNGLNTAANATNYAQGGSRVSDPNCASPCAAATAQPMTVQIDRALAKGNFNARDLVVVWIGANDVFANATLAGADIARATAAAGRPLTSAEQTSIVGGYVIRMEQAALTTLAQVRRLKAAGAERIVLMTIPNAALSPLGVVQGASGQALFTALSDAFNNQIKREIQLSDPGVLLVDAGALSASYYRSPSANGFTNVNVPVCDSTRNRTNPADPSSFTSLICFNIPGVGGTFVPEAVAPAATSLFADLVHPTIAAHAKFGSAVYDALKAKGWVK